MKFLTLLALAAAMAAPGVHAGNDAVVEAVQAPAWVQRAGAYQPLAPGMVLSGGDRIRTGANSRLYLKLAEGSRVKLGEHAQFVVDQVGTRSDGVFAAVLKVLTGAFRFTTAAVARPQRRDVSIQVSTITAGVRGTDLWGKSGDDRDLVCLLEGRIGVRHEGGTEATMSEAGSFFLAPKDSPPEPVSKVDAAQIAEWAKETEIASGQGAAVSGGLWKVILAQGAAEDTALDRYLRAREAGYLAELWPRPAARQSHVYDVFVSGLRDQADARALAARLGKAIGLSDLKTTR